MAEVPPFDPEAPLERIAGESLKCNAALVDYAMMGPGRSLRKLCAKYIQQAKQGLAPPSQHIATIESWSYKFGWVARVEAWRQLQDAITEERWLIRQAELRERDWEIGSKLLALGESIFAEGPKYLKTRRRTIKETGETVITVELDGHLGVKVLDLASKLRRSAAGMETQRIQLEHTGPDGGPIYVVPDVSGLDDEQLRDALLKLGSVAAALAGEEATGTGTDLPAIGADDADDDTSGEICIPIDA